YSSRIQSITTVSNFSAAVRLGAKYKAAAGSTNPVFRITARQWSIRQRIGSIQHNRIDRYKFVFSNRQAFQAKISIADAFRICPGSYRQSSVDASIVSRYCTQLLTCKHPALWQYGTILCIFNTDLNLQISVRWYGREIESTIGLYLSNSQHFISGRRINQIGI